ncbi:Cystathionine beta-lyase [compost metagenome]
MARVYYPALEQDPGHALWRRDYSGASGLVSFAFKHPEAAAAARFIDALTYFSIGASWGGYESLALEAAPERLAEHSAWRDAGKGGSVVRLHIGLENSQDLIDDLERAFGATRDALRRTA